LFLDDGTEKVRDWNDCLNYILWRISSSSRSLYDESIDFLPTGENSTELAFCQAKKEVRKQKSDENETFVLLSWGCSAGVFVQHGIKFYENYAGFLFSRKLKRRKSLIFSLWLISWKKLL